jgi:hypothetical protein
MTHLKNFMVDLLNYGCNYVIKKSTIVSMYYLAQIIRIFTMTYLGAFV